MIRAIFLGALAFGCSTSEYVIGGALLTTDPNDHADDPGNLGVEIEPSVIYVSALSQCQEAFVGVAERWGGAHGLVMKRASVTAEDDPTAVYLTFRRNDLAGTIVVKYRIALDQGRVIRTVAEVIYRDPDRGMADQTAELVERFQLRHLLQNLKTAMKCKPD